MPSKGDSQSSLMALQQMPGLCSLLEEGKQHFMVEWALRHLILHYTASDGQGNCRYRYDNNAGPHIALL